LINKNTNNIYNSNINQVISQEDTINESCKTCRGEIHETRHLSNLFHFTLRFLLLNAILF